MTLTVSPSDVFYLILIFYFNTVEGTPYMKEKKQKSATKCRCKRSNRIMIKAIGFHCRITQSREAKEFIQNEAYLLAKNVIIEHV